VQASTDEPVSYDEVVEAVLSASRALVGVAARSLAAAEEEVTLPQYRALVVLASRGTQRVLDLAEALGVNQSTITRMCDRLESKRLISRQRPPDNRRTVLVSITASGEELVAAVTRRRRREIRAIVRRMSGQTQTSLVEAMASFAAAAGEAPEQAWSLGWT